MIKMVNSKENDARDSQKLYTPPCVVKISELKHGAGAGCMPTGSGDVGNCSTGNNASGTYGCYTSGNSASGDDGCYTSGNSASGRCYPTGSSGGCYKD